MTPVPVHPVAAVEEVTLAALPAFLRHLAAFPSAASAVQALFHGPLAHCGAVAGSVWRLTAERELVLLANVGNTREEVERYGVVPLSVDVGIVRALRVGGVVVDAMTDYERTVLGGLDADLWNGLRQRLGAVSVVSVPLFHRGEPMGALGFISAHAWGESPVHEPVVRGVGGALGLWLSHPLNGLGPATSPVGRGASLALSARQRRALVLAEQGLTNAAIARELGVSDSAVKSDLRLAMQALRVHDRRDAARRARALGLLDE